MESLLEYINKTTVSKYANVSVVKMNHRRFINVDNGDISFNLFILEHQRDTHGHGTATGDTLNMHIPSKQEWIVILDNLDEINRLLEENRGDQIQEDMFYWTSDSVDSQHYLVCDIKRHFFKTFDITFKFPIRFISE